MLVKKNSMSTVQNIRIIEAHNYVVVLPCFYTDTYVTIYSVIPLQNHFLFIIRKKLEN